ncbi:type III secretion system inner membrane ring subunit SctD [Chlamydia sp. 17-3921]|uniref:type III secretion system inner membrane ring subunit SctD n=1 Tax=Chlamydia sp. 17-3921 TaxID=2675798 RepID=UPI00191A664F|nr:type III secretion system inner membrane ring subunit SctD [Chlamydia sp. 17-3921]
MAARLIIDKGPLSGVIFVLDEGTSWSIGKDPKSNDIPIEDPTVALLQAVIDKTGNSYFITNIDDAFPILVNGQEITETVPLKNADILAFGSNEYSFFVEAFDSEDVVYDFAFPEQNSSNALGISADNNEQQNTMSPTVEQKSVKEASLSKKKASSKEEKVTPTTKDQKLAEAFLSSAQTSDTKANKKKIDLKKTKTSQKEKEQTQEPKKIMEDNGASSNSKLPLPASTTPPSSKTDNLKTDEVADTTDQIASSENLEKKQSGEEDSIDEIDETEEEDSKKETSEDTESDAKIDLSDDQDGEKEEEISDSDKSEKKNVLAPFNVQDLFRFDQGIFLAEVNDGAHNNVSIDFSQPPRFLLKVLAGANIGAEYYLESGKSYILGADPAVCDIVFSDLSVSHKHAKITVGSDEAVLIEDLGSKNGVIVESRKIEHSSTLTSNQVVALGTTLFLLIDHQAPADTIVAAFASEDYGLFGRPQDAEAIAKQAAQEEEEKQKRATLPTGSFILTLFIGGLAILFGVGTASLFHTKEIIPLENINYQEDLERITHQFPSVRCTFNDGNGQLFLIGHVKNSIDKSELLYKVDTLAFVKAVDDNVIDDEAVWQEMNILLSKRPEFKGINMSSPEPGKFVITGYVKTTEQAGCLIDYLNLHFNYLSLLENKVIVETQMLKAIAGQLLQNGFANIQVAFVNGEVILTGYVNNDAAEKFRTVVEELSNIPGVRLVKNFAVLLPAEEGIIDLNLRHPNRYRVTGYSKYGDVSINVVVNGKILTRGDLIDGMTVTSIQPNTIFLEREGLKYKIDYNK